VSDNTLAVGAPYHNGYMGAIYIFTGSGSSWTLQDEITDPLNTAFDYFGASLGVEDHGILTGGAESAGGAVYALAGSGSTWTVQQTIVPADRGAADAFGFSLAVDGSKLVVGSPQHGGGGAIYFYSESKENWTQRGEFQDPGTSATDALGTSVAIDDSTAVAGAPSSDYSQVGTAYVYRQSDNAWAMKATLHPSDGVTGDAFGWPVAIDGSTILAASSNHNGGAGVAYVFTKGHGDKWSQAQELAPSDPQPGAFFGWPTLTFDGSDILISAPYTTGGTLYWFSPQEH
ncbi:MAG: hypothetical protein JOZ46_10565, partial [Candidatus Dormibacteraeota bacterium]|nr:hypothetical protein [Candidatus Dormibacteraeota bacterium]